MHSQDRGSKRSLNIYDSMDLSPAFPPEVREWIFRIIYLFNCGKLLFLFRCTLPNFHVSCLLAKNRVDTLVIEVRSSN